MPSTSFFVAVLALATNLAVVSAGDWWVIGYQQNYCYSDDRGDTLYNWKGSDSNCHTFGHADTGCVFGTRDKNGNMAAVNCGVRREPSSILSMDYNEGMGNDGTGCLFFDEANCRGDSEQVPLAKEIDKCFEFNTAKKSFQCF